MEPITGATPQAQDPPTLHGACVLMPASGFVAMGGFGLTDTFVGRRHPRHLLLEMPGGKVNPGEDVRFAAFREYVEETGMVPSALHKLCETTHTNRDGHRYILHAFLGWQFPTPAGMMVRMGLRDEAGGRLIEVSRAALCGDHAMYPDANRAVFQALDAFMASPQEARHG